MKTFIQIFTEMSNEKIVSKFGKNINLISENFQSFGV